MFEPGLRIELDGERMHPDGDLRFDDRDRHQLHYVWRTQCDSVEKESSDKRRHPQNLEANEISSQMMYFYYDITANGEEGMHYVADKVDRRADFQIWGDHQNCPGRPQPAQQPHIQMVITWFNARHLALEDGIQNAWLKASEIPDHTVTLRHLNTLRTGRV